MADDEKMILTPEQAEALLPKGKYVHNFVNPSGGVMIGCDYDRPDAIKALKDAESIEVAGPGAMAMEHPIAVWDNEGRVSFFAADMAKVEALSATAKDPLP